MLWGPVIQWLSPIIGGRSPFKGLPRGATESFKGHFIREACIATTGKKPELSGRTVGPIDIDHFSDDPGFVTSIRVLELQDVCVDGGTAAVLDAQGRLITELSPYSKCSAVDSPWDHPAFLQFRNTSELEIVGPCVLLANPQGKVYFHWVMELLPRLDLLKQAGFDGQGATILVPSDARFVRETLHAAGIEQEKIVVLQTGLAYHIDNLFTTSDLDPQSSITSFASFYQNLFLPSEAPTRIPFLYISRRSAGLRKIVGEETLIEIIRGLDGEVAVLEDLGVREQAELFRRADCIVGPHGSAFANVVFCCPGTSILELFSPAYVRVLYGRIATALDLDYWYLIGGGESEKEGQPQLYAAIDIDAKLFQSALKAIAESRNSRAL